MRIHTTVNGRSIDYDPSPEEEAFLGRVGAAALDSKCSEGALRALIFGLDNPLLDQQAGYSFMVGAALEEPVFRVLLDLLDRKRIACGTLDLARTAAKYTLSVTEAAARIGVGESTVRMAVLDGRLPSWMKSGEIYLAPDAVDRYQVSRRGRPPQLQVTCGNAPGISMRIRVVGGELDITEKKGSLVHGVVRSWKQVGVITMAKRKTGDRGEVRTQRYWLLEPGGEANDVTLGPLKVEGRFKVTDQQNGDSAHDAWKHLGGLADRGQT
jgi:excisionase family DNA binding protein